jgi:protein-tyrosine-phosphatase
MIHALASLQPADFLKLLAHDLRWQLLTALSRSDHRVHELVSLLDQPANLVSYHLKRLRDQHLVTEHRSSADGRDIYYSLEVETLRTHYITAGEALHPALAEGAATPQAQASRDTEPVARVLFLCTHNSARSQMAEGILRHLSGGRVEAYSAGSEPTSIHPYAVLALADLGIDGRQQQPKHLDAFRGQAFDYIVTVCDRVREVCPAFPDDPERIHWSIPDPAVVEGDTETQYRVFTRTAQELVTRIRYLLTLINREKGKAV